MDDKSKFILDVLLDRKLFPPLVVFTYEHTARIVRGYVELCDTSVSSVFLSSYNDSHGTAYTHINQIPSDKFKSVVIGVLNRIKTTILWK